MRIYLEKYNKDYGKTFELEIDEYDKIEIDEFYNIKVDEKILNENIFGDIMLFNPNNNSTIFKKTKKKYHENDNLIVKILDVKNVERKNLYFGIDTKFYIKVFLQSTTEKTLHRKISLFVKLNNDVLRASSFEISPGDMVLINQKMPYKFLTNKQSQNFGKFEIAYCLYNNGHLSVKQKVFIVDLLYNQHCGISSLIYSNTR
ncbi:hypothetical protein MNL76_10080 [Fervidobacterium riparium]|nr:hypothetical protein IB67_02470 [Fervidobacterium riparium]